jgi:hypothetical protein
MRLISIASEHIPVFTVLPKATVLTALLLAVPPATMLVLLLVTTSLTPWALPIDERPSVLAALVPAPLATPLVRFTRGATAATALGCGCAVSTAAAAAVERVRRVCKGGALTGCCCCLLLLRGTALLLLAAGFTLLEGCVRRGSRLGAASAGAAAALL